MSYKFFFAQTIPNKKYLQQCKEIKQNWTEPENSDIYFCVNFDIYFILMFDRYC